jgi:serine/threonine protein phosphatase PrpC
METSPSLTWTSAARSHVGTVRKINEDAYLAIPELGLWVVADGMGGHEAGDVASRMIVETLSQLLPPADWERYFATVETQLRQVNQQLRRESAQHYHSRIIGSTVAILLAYQGRGACLWVGDSRVYRLRDHRLEQLTRDHSHVQELLDQGLIRPEEANDHPLGNVITRALGSAEELRIDNVVFPLEVGDIFLLCSDGLTKAVTDEEITKLLGSDNSDEAVQALIHSALVRQANDNVTAVVVHVERDRSNLDSADSTRAWPPS